MRRFLPTVFLALVTLACGSASPTTRPPIATSRSQPTTAPRSTSTPRGSTFADPLPLESAGRHNGFEIVVIAADYAPVFLNNIDEPQQPDSGMQFIRVDLAVACMADEPCSVYGGDYQLADRSGVLFDDFSRGWRTGVDNPLDDIELVPGGAATGSLGFEVPTDGAPYVLVYDGAIYFALP